jgi:hypothetical protein
MWGETDDEKNFNCLQVMLQLALIVIALSVSRNIPRGPKPAFC